MTEEQVLNQIKSVVTQMLTDKGQNVSDIQPDSELLGGAVGIDSLDLAMLVRELEEFAGFDPFQEGFVEFRTAGELAKLYIK